MEVQGVGTKYTKYNIHKIQKINKNIFYIFI